MSKRKPARTVRLGCERLESRCLMAGDATFSIQVLDTSRMPVSELDIGEQFVLQIYSQGTWGPLADLTFDSALAKLSDDAQFSPLFPERHSFSRFDERDGNWRLSAFAQGEGATHDNLKEKHLVMEVSGQALAGGEIVFQLNADSGVVGLDGEFVTADFGYARVQIGDKTLFPASPWRNPGNPADVDGNGQVDLKDAGEVLDTIAYDLGPDGSLERLPKLVAPFSDVSGDRLINYDDLMMVMDHLPSQPSPSANRFARHLMDPDFKITFEATNLRTGEQVAQEVLEGDVLRVRLKASTNRHKTIEVQSNLFSPDLRQYDLLTEVEEFESLSIVPWPDPVFFVQMNKLGEKTLTIQINTSVAFRAAQALGLDFTEIPNYLSRLNKLVADAAIPLTVKANANRPEAADKTYTYNQFENVTVEQAAKLISSGKTDLVVGKTEGLLGASPVAGSRAYFVSPGYLASSIVDDWVELNDDGSFSFRPFSPGHALHSVYHTLNNDLEFKYVIINPSGTSQVAKFRIDGVAVPFIEIRVFAVDQAGNEVTQLAPGQRFTLKATTVSNLSAYNVPATSVHNHNVLGFKFRYQFDRTVGTAQSAPAPNTDYYTEFHRLSEKDGKLTVIAEKIPASMKLDGGKYIADFKGYTLASTFAPVSLFEHEMIANAVGQLNVKLDNLTSTADFDPSAIRLDVSKIEVVGEPSLSQNFLNPKDVNDDKKITATDALLVINGLSNLAGKVDRALTLARNFAPGHHLDVNADGMLSASDALSIINELNLAIDNRATQMQLTDSSSNKFGIEMNPTRSNESLVVRMLGATPEASYPVLLDGRNVGQVTTDQRGRGRLVVNKDTLSQVMLSKQSSNQTVRLEVGSLIATDLSIDLN